MPTATTTTRKSRSKKKTTPRSRAKTFTKEELDAEIRRKEADIKRKLMKKLEDERKAAEVEEEEFGTPRRMSIFGGPSGPSYNELSFDDEESPENIRREQEDINSFDIFEFVNTNYTLRGTPVVFQVKKDNAILGEFGPPLSWKKIQEKHGGGVYTIIAKHGLTKQYIKQDTKQVLDVDRPVESAQVAPAPTNPLDMTQILTSMMGFIQNTHSEAQKTREREDRSVNQANSGMNTSFVEMLNSTQSNTMNMLQTIQQSTMSLMEKMSENTNRLIEKQNDKVDKIMMMNNTKKDDGPNWMQVMTMTKQAESEGWNKFMKMQEWTEAKAEELAEARTPEPQNDSSMTGSIIKSLIPMFTGMAQGGAQAPRGPVPPPQYPAPPRQALPGPHAPAPTQPRATQAAPGGAPGGPGVVSNPQTQKSPLGLPTFTDEKNMEEIVDFDENELDAEAQNAEILDAGVQEEVETEVEVSEGTEALFQNANEIQQKIASITVPAIAGQITNPTIPPGEVARLCLLTLRDQGITGKTVLLEFPFDFMIKIVKSFNIDVSEGSTYDEWFREFYAYIENTTGIHDSGQHGGNETV